MALIQQSNPTAPSPTPSTNQVITPTHIGLIPTESFSFKSPNDSGNSLTFYCHSHTSLGTWILDSGATDHICCSLTHFVQYMEIKPIDVRLPNGSLVAAHYAGTVQLSPSLSLSNVLFIP